MLAVLPDCPCCRGGQRLALSDEPGNVIPLFASADGVCPVCRQVASNSYILQLPSRIADFYAELPWSSSPLHRVLEKCLLLTALSEGDLVGAERLVCNLYQRYSEERTEAKCQS